MPGRPAIYHCLRRLHAREPHACRECIDAPLESPDQMQQLTGWPSGLHALYVQGAAETRENVNNNARSLSIHSDLRIPF